MNCSILCRTAVAILCWLVFLAPEITSGAATMWLDCTFGPLPEQEFARLHLMTIGDRVERAVVEPLGLAATDVSGLKIAGGKLTGALVIGHDTLSMNRSLAPRLATRMALELNLSIVDGQVAGTFAGFWPKAKTLDTPLAVEGAVTGVARDEESLRKDFGLPDDATWASWLGAHQNFSVGGGRDASPPLVDDLHDAQLLWVSQWIGPTESGSHRYGACVGAPPCAGGASPLVAGGRVFQFRYEAAGDDVQQQHLDAVMTGEKGADTRAKMAAIGWTDADMRRRWAIRADEQLVAIDAATGRTVWKVDWPGEGVNLFDHKCSLTNHTGVAALGNVYVFGAMGIVRCVDAESGQQQWSARVPGYADLMDAFLAKSIQEQITRAPTRSFCHALNVSGDVVLAPDGIGACGVVALDARTGELRWRVKDRVLGKCATPMAWRKDDKDYVAAASEAGTITLIEAATGRIVWQYDQAGDNEYQTLLVGDLLMGHKLKQEERESAPQTLDDGPHSAPGLNYGQVACWRLTLEGPKLLWTAPAEWGAPANSPIGSAADGLICFRGNYSYHLVDPETGKRVGSRHLTAPVRWDEGHMLALADRFVLHPDSQHGHTKMFLLPARAAGEVSSVWSPPHPWATTYQSAMSHAWADGRLFIRGADALYCYDLRRRP
ncbi:outer membrane protein assembly factor BamB family protein [Lignipirellula cremea]|uniref:Outer membrane biogenesis protein BamB n=1 Tax=Lignipirellula cremea TaxID=2528010 RepID=A0A518DKE7_9BACT|nr:PQQ-binding-like beta-propeller repeat protein [Lignipirellula cremea]QDU92313.1 outer membrane biogenesis protein BamB [Lignipirellula cremea]